MSSRDSLRKYLTWQAELGGDAIILDEKPEQPQNIRDSSSPPLSLVESLDRIISSPSQVLQSDIQRSIGNAKKEYKLPEFASVKEIYRFLEESELYTVSGSGTGFEKLRIVHPTGPEDPCLSVVALQPAEADLSTGNIFQDKEGCLLDKMLLAIGIQRQDVFCTCVLKSPFLKKKLSWREIEFHRQILIKELSLVKNRFILLLGEKCARLMLKTGKSLDDLRKKLHNFEKNDILDDRIAVVTYHPLQLILNRKLKYFAWDDLKWIQKELQKNQDR